MHFFGSLFPSDFAVSRIAANLDLSRPGDLTVIADVGRAKECFVFERREYALTDVAGKIDNILRSVSVGDLQPILRQRFDFDRPNHDNIIARSEALSNTGNRSSRTKRTSRRCAGGETLGSRTRQKDRHMSSAKQRAAARRNIKKAAAAAKRKRTVAHLPKKTRTALGKEGAKAAKRKRR